VTSATGSRRLSAKPITPSGRTANSVGGGYEAGFDPRFPAFAKRDERGLRSSKDIEQPEGGAFAINPTRRIRRTITGTQAAGCRVPIEAHAKAAIRDNECRVAMCPPLER